MKKLIVLAVVAIAVAIAGSAVAFDVGGTLKKGAATVAKGSMEKDINNKLSGKTCNYNPKTEVISGCDLKKISKDLAAKRKLAEKGGSAYGSYTDFDILIHTKDYNAYKAADNQMKGYGVPGWDTRKVGGAKNKITFSVDIK
jgi:hypothetical protein